MEAIGKIIATEKQPSTIEEFTFWTRKDLKLKPFDVVVVDHVMDAQGNPTKTYGVIEEISHMTDSPSALAGYISSDFGQVDSQSYTERIGMNYVKCKVVGNTSNIYIPVQEGRKVYLAERDEIMEALGLNDVKHNWARRCTPEYLRNFRLGIKNFICHVFDESYSGLCNQNERGICRLYHDECKGNRPLENRSKKYT